LQRIANALVCAMALGACSSALDGPVGPGVAISVAPLTLSGVTNARYRLVVENGSDEIVTDVELTADRYGDGAGSLSYVAPCDADDNDNEVRLTLIDLYADGSATPIDPGTYVNPGPLSRTVTCVEGGDVAVRFDLTIARAATQGFFDVAIELDDVFCSAKLDCLKDPDDPSSTIALLFNDDGERDTTFVMGFACTGGPGAGDETWQYLDDVEIACGVDVVRVDVGAGIGVLPASAFTQVSGTQSPLFGAAVFQGEEQLPGYDKQYWNVALGFAGGDGCHVSALATASSGALTADTTPSGTSWPLIGWEVDLTDGDGDIVCTQHPISDDTCPGSGVCVTYTGLDETETFTNAFGPTLPAAACTPGSQVFTATGADQTFTVPDGCDYVTARLWGAGGGGSTGAGAYAHRSHGGGGGFATGSLSVTPGETLTVIVGEGGGGSDDTGFTPYGGGTPATGYQGGGGGGGRSAIRRAGGTEEITAGGGGGGGYGDTATAGAPGGALIGGAPTSGHDGGPGTPTGGGAPGAGATLGAAGAAYQGGAGASWCGGGGGGYFGGAGGSFTSGVEAGSGGGGAGYVGGVLHGRAARGVGATPGEASAPDLPAGVAVGGAPGASGTWGTGAAGGPGLVILSWGVSPTATIPAEAQAFVAASTAAGVTPTAAEQDAIATFVGQLQTTGVWPALYAVYPMMGGTSASAALELTSGGAAVMTGSLTAGTTATPGGIVGTGGYFEAAVSPADLGPVHGLYAYLNRVDEDTPPPQYTNAIVSIRSPLTNNASVQEYDGHLLAYSGSDYFDVAYAARSVTAHTRLPAGGYGMVRSRADRIAVFRDGAVDAENTTASPAPLTLNTIRFGVLAHGGEQASSAFAARVAGAAFVSGPFSDADMQALHDAFDAFAAALGRAAP